jgi:glycosyltransferase involved in cell wall biosynthesis
MPVDMLIPVRDEYLLFRQLYESVRFRIPDEEIGKIIVVDDHSSDKRLRRYTKYLDKRGQIRLIRNGIPLPSYYTGIPIPFLRSKGHGSSLNIGLRYVTNPYVFILDPDCIILRGDVLKNSIPCFDLDPDILAIGQVVGGVRGATVIGNEERVNLTRKTDYVRKRPHQYGYINACCMVAKIDAWREHNLTRFWNRGWAHAPFARSIFEQGFKTCNFDYFLDGYVVHLGRAFLKKMRLRHLRFRIADRSKKPYGMSSDKARYSAKHQGEYYGGYFELKIPSEEYDILLEKKYGNVPFGETAPHFDVSIFGPPDMRQGKDADT